MGETAGAEAILVGGGLQNSLLALALLHRAPELYLTLVERERVLGGNHTWCFHARDVPMPSLAWLEPLVVHRWPGYQVRFPGLVRDIQQPYAAITSERLDAVLRERLAGAPHARLLAGCAARRVESGSVELADGRLLHARLVVDARGPELEYPPACGFQKFVGLEVVLASDSLLGSPLLMDATVAQRDGFRFLYLLPLGRRRLLAEETVFSDRPQLEALAMRTRVLAYLEERGFAVRAVLREEKGVLPMPFGGPGRVPRPDPLRAGYAGGFFHPATGYSLPAAVRLAELVAGRAPDPPPRRALLEHWRRHQRQARFARWLNWVMFRLVQPEERWRIFAAFHRLPEETISRFYALELGTVDRLRILGLRPPPLKLRRLVAPEGRILP
jgi:lycopene beta-cyclase